MNPPELHGLVAEFEEPERLVAAVRAAREKGYRKIDAYSPFPIEGLAEEMGLRFTGVPLAALLCGITGGTFGYAMQFYSATIDYPLNVGGRPPHSWPAFVPIVFELTVLFAALGTALSMLVLNGLPRLHHPIFETPFFAERNASHFFFCIEATDPQFGSARAFLDEQTASHVWEVRP